MFRKMQFYQKMLLLVVAWSGLIAAPQAFAYKQIVAGADHTCRLTNNGSVTCWGAGKTNTGNSPELGQSIVPSNALFTQISAGGYHTCGLGIGGDATCWGSNDFGESIVPSGTFTQLSAGYAHTCGLKSDGSVTCWGAGKTSTGVDPEYGQSIVPIGTFTQISASYFHTCGLKSDGSAICWGDNEDGQTNVTGGTFVQLSVGWYHTCGLKSNGSATCWGSNDYGRTAPSGTFTQISAGESHTCGLKSDGSAICWGWNGYGQSIVPNGTFTQLSAGGRHTCGLKSDGSVICWGLNDKGQTNVPVASGKIMGISTRALVGTTAEKYMMAGVFVQGTTPKQAIVRATGKGLTKQGVSTTLDAKLEVYQLGKTSVFVDDNDNWKSHLSSSTVKSMSDDSDAALATSLKQGYYSMVVMPSGGSMTSGGGSSQGIGLIEVYDVFRMSTSRLSGISTRSYVGSSAADYMYAGVAVQGDVKLLIRGLGKELIARGVAGALDDAMITVRNVNGTIVNSNDNWQTHSSSSTLTQRGQAPKDSSDAAMIINLSEGLYTIEVKSAKGGQGVALVEVYEIVD